LLAGVVLNLSASLSVWAQTQEAEPATEIKKVKIKSLHDVSFKESKAKRIVMNTRRFYDHSAGFRRNSIRIQLLQLPMSLRFTYERSINLKLAVGANASIRFLGEEAGSTRLEVYGKYFLSHRAPIGLYGYSSLGLASVQNHTFTYRVTSTEGGVVIKYNPNRPDVIERTASFSSVSAGFGLGFQNVFGPGRKFISDFGIGYQLNTIPSNYKSSITQDQVVYGQFDANRGFLSVMSPIAVRIGLGYVF
jgi:hypothetical protein